MRRLIIRPGAIGDFIVSLPALEALRADYTEVWTTETNRPLARFADQTASIVGTGLDAFGLPGRAVNEILLKRLQSFDSIVSWYGAARPEFREYIQSLNLPFEFHRALPPEGAAMHAVDYYLSQVQGSTPVRAGEPPSIVMPRLAAAGAALHTAVNTTVIHPFSGSAQKNWPLERFRELARALVEAGLGPVLWCAGPEEKLDDAVRFTDLGALADWLSGARLYVGNDSGISHLAAAVDVPVVALFGSTDPEVWAPRGRWVEVVQSDGASDAPSMHSIAVSEVLQRCLSLANVKG